MESIYKDSKVKLGDEEWIVRYYARVIHPRTGVYVKVARVPSKREIWLSVNDESDIKFKTEEVTANFQKAILPIVIDDIKKRYGEEKVNEALEEMGYKR